MISNSIRMVPETNRCKIYVYLVLITCICVFLASCSNKNDIPQEYVISHEDSIIGSKYKKDGMLAPPRVNVGTYNLIVDSSNRYYFYSFQPPILNSFINDGVADEKKQIANLRPNHIFIIPVGYEKEFILANVIEIKNHAPFKSIVIASYKDSIDAKIILFIKKFQIDTANHIVLLIRPVQKTEKEVLGYKLKGEYYH